MSVYGEMQGIHEYLLKKRKPASAGFLWVLLARYFGACSVALYLASAGQAG